MPDRQLLLVRHAQAEQTMPDRSRQLTDRGRRDAQALGKWLGGHGLVPELAVLSPAVRAAQTWAAIAAGLGHNVMTEVDRRLYAEDLDGLVAIVAGLDESLSTVALVGHNPPMHRLALRLAGDGADDRLASFPTATVAVVAVDGTWESHRTRLVDVVTCRD